MGQKPYSIAEIRVAPYTNVTTGAVGTYVSMPRRKTATFEPTTDEITNEYDGGRDTIIRVTGGTLSFSGAGVPLPFIAATLGLTIVTSGTGSTLVDKLDIPLSNVPPLMKAQFRKVTGDGGDMIEEYDGVRFQPVPGISGEANAWADSTFSASVDGLDVANKFTSISQRATAAALV